jgi:hypothetical protein
VRWERQPRQLRRERRPAQQPHVRRRKRFWIKSVAARLSLDYDDHAAIQLELQNLQALFGHRFSGASQVNVAYTWAKNLTDNQTDRSTAPQNSYDIHADYGRATLDRRHILTANYIYDIPLFAKRHDAVGRAFGGWEISGIVTLQSGLPFTPATSSWDPAGLD